MNTIQGSLEAASTFPDLFYNSMCSQDPQVVIQLVIQGSAKRRDPGLENFAPAVAYQYCLGIACGIHATWGPPFGRALYMAPRNVCNSYLALILIAHGDFASAKRRYPGLVNYVTALAYYFCHSRNLGTTFQPSPACYYLFLQVKRWCTMIADRSQCKERCRDFGDTVCSAAGSKVS